MEEEGFEDMGIYVLKRHITVTQYITTRPILDLCENMDRSLGAWVARIWWQNEGLYLAGARAMEATEV